MIQLAVVDVDPTRMWLSLVADQLNLKGADQPLILNADRFTLIESFAVDSDDASCIESRSTADPRCWSINSRVMLIIPLVLETNKILSLNSEWFTVITMAVAADASARIGKRSATAYQFDRSWCRSTWTRIKLMTDSQFLLIIIWLVLLELISSASVPIDLIAVDADRLILGLESDRLLLMFPLVILWALILIDLFAVDADDSFND